MKIRILSGQGYNDMKDVDFPLVVEARFFRQHYWVKKTCLPVPIFDLEQLDVERVFRPDMVEVVQ